MHLQPRGGKKSIKDTAYYFRSEKLWSYLPTRWRLVTPFEGNCTPPTASGIVVKCGIRRKWDLMYPNHDIKTFDFSAAKFRLFSFKPSVLPRRRPSLEASNIPSAVPTKGLNTPPTSD